MLSVRANLSHAFLVFPTLVERTSAMVGISEAVYATVEDDNHYAASCEGDRTKRDLKLQLVALYGEQPALL
jgi:hypothetical protein